VPVTRYERQSAGSVCVVEQLFGQHEALGPDQRSVVAGIAERQADKRRSVVEVDDLLADAARQTPAGDLTAQVGDRQAAVVDDFLGRYRSRPVDDVALRRVADGVRRCRDRADVGFARRRSGAKVPAARDGDVDAPAGLSVGVVVADDPENGERIVAAIPLRGSLCQLVRKEHER
jgi:hypothetical protein